MSGVLESLQRRLVGSLHSQLAKDESGQRMVVLGADDSVDENQGLQEAHKRARAIGARRKAVLIIWGSRAGESRFFPRITIVPQTNEISLSGEQTLMVQDIHNSACLTRTWPSQFTWLIFSRAIPSTTKENTKKP